MKKVIQLILLILLIVLIFLFFNTYFKKDKKIELENLTIENKNLETQTQNNLIKNLKYNVKFDDNNEYIIDAELSELTYKNKIEVVKMQKVRASIIDKNNIPLIITSDTAEYNTFNFNTFFRGNVEVLYLNHIIYSEKLDLNLDENTILVHNNVIYEGPQGRIFTDNIIVDLLLKDINIYMDSGEKKVEVINKE